MDIQQVAQSQLSNLKEGTLHLRTGQIIQGNIHKLFPNNKAQIQLGTNKLIAQLEASLEVGARYHFQVKSTDNVILLKVLGDSLDSGHNSQMNYLHLLRQLGIKHTKLNQEFVGLLLQNKIPFDKGQLQNAIALLNAASDKGQAKMVLQDMILNKTPLTEALFQALSSRFMGSFTERMVTLEAEMQQPHTTDTKLKQDLLSQLKQFSGNSSEIRISQLSPLLDSPEIVNVLKVIGVIDRDIPFSSWSNRVNQMMNQNVAPVNQLLQIDTPKQLGTILSNLTLINQQANSLLTNWGELLHLNITKNLPLSNESFANLKQEVEQSIFRLTPRNLDTFINNPQHLKALLADIEILANTKNYGKLDSLLHHMLKEAFLSQKQLVLQEVGLNYEKTILQSGENPSKTLKGMLLQLLQSSDGSIQEHATRLLQSINGLQLQSVLETDKLLQANLIMPGKVFGMEKDIGMSFEGKRTDDGELNPDYCRVMFFLDLKSLDQTVIDMQVQKRAVSLSILNDNDISDITQSLKPILKSGLEKLDYHLSSVIFRPLTMRDSTPNNKVEVEKQQYEGVDFRI
jgi:ABC-type uncharacterized transport system YnjBCD ATPase subunit